MVKKSIVVNDRPQPSIKNFHPKKKEKKAQNKAAFDNLVKKIMGKKKMKINDLPYGYYDVYNNQSQRASSRYKIRAASFNIEHQRASAARKVRPEYPNEGHSLEQNKSYSKYFRRR